MEIIIKVQCKCISVAFRIEAIKRVLSEFIIKFEKIKQFLSVIWSPRILENFKLIDNILHG